MHKIGIIDYDDVINKEYMVKMAESLNNLCIFFNNFATKEAIENRESELIEKYKGQYEADIYNIKNIRENAQNIADMCNKAMFEMTGRALYKHIDESLV